MVLGWEIVSGVVNCLPDAVFGAFLSGDFDGPCFVIRVGSSNTIDALGGVRDAFFTPVTGHPLDLEFVPFHR